MEKGDMIASRQIKKISNSRQAIILELKNAIQHGFYNPGDKLPTLRVLGERFGTTHSNAAIAINRLTEEGLLSKRQGSGVFVKRLTDVDPLSLKIHSLYPMGPETLIPLEGFKERNYDLKLYDGIGFHQADISILGTSGLFESMRDNKLLPLNDFMSKSGVYAEDFHPGAVKSITSNNNIYAIPIAFAPELLFYNRELVTPPASVINRWTLDDMLDYIKKNGSRFMRMDVRPFNHSHSFAFQVFPYLSMFGADVYEAENNTCLLDRPLALKAFQYVLDLLHTVPDKFTTTYSMEKAFCKGQIAFAKYAGRLNVKIKSLNLNNLQVAPMPQGNFSSRIAGGSWICINSNCQNPEQAWRLLNYFAKPQTQKIIAESHYLFPGRIDAIEHLKSLNPEAYSPIIERLNSDHYITAPIAYRDLRYLDQILEDWHESQDLNALLQKCCRKLETRLKGNHVITLGETTGL